VLWFLMPFVPFTIVGGVTGAFPNGFAQLVAVAALMTAGFAAAMGPQIVRSDLRRDLVHLDVLKTWPISPASLVRGAILWPTTQLTALIWLALVVGAALSSLAFPEVAPVWRLVSAVSAVVLAPALVAAQLVIHNGVALLFPAWVSLGGQRPRGLEATGQRLITLAGSWLALALMAVPGGIAGAIVWFLLTPWVGPLAMVPAACSSAGVLMLEALGLTHALGSLFEGYRLV
jgi:ABC-2 type transport system permease protein